MNDAKRTSGRVACTGLAEGPPCVINRYEDLSKINPGDIVVTAQTDMNYVPFLLHAGGLITETGGRCCHAAIYARENRLPCIVSVPGARTFLSGTNRVRLDGDNNEVVVLSCESTYRENDNGRT